MGLRIPGGAIFFNQLIAGVYDGELKLASTQGFSTQVAEQTLASYNNDDDGVGVKEDEVITQSDQTGTMPTRGITYDVLAMVFKGSKGTVAQAAGSISDSLVGVKLGRYYQLGRTPTRVTGARKLSNQAFTVGVTPLVQGTDYEFNAELGRLYLLPTAANVADGATIDYTADTAATSWTFVISGSEVIEGELRIVGQDAKGDPQDYFYPKVTISVNGDFVVKGSPEQPAYQEVPFQVSILKDTARGLEPVYIDGRPPAA